MTASLYQSGSTAGSIDGCAMGLTVGATGPGRNRLIAKPHELIARTMTKAVETACPRRMSRHRPEGRCSWKQGWPRRREQGAAVYKPPLGAICKSPFLEGASQNERGPSTGST